jgi:hypothetical protein
MIEHQWGFHSSSSFSASSSRCIVTHFIVKLKFIVTINISEVWCYFATFSFLFWAFIHRLYSTELTFQLGEHACQVLVMSALPWPPSLAQSSSTFATDYILSLLDHFKTPFYLTLFYAVQSRVVLNLKSRNISFSKTQINLCLISAHLHHIPDCVHNSLVFKSKLFILK